MMDKKENDILFSRTVKAGKRVYYIDVKCDRKGDFYLSLTESKRLKDVDDMQKPMFEKHKIFLYREDLNKFQRALSEAADFAQQEAHTAGAVEWAGDYAPVEGMSNYEEEEEDEQQLGLELEFWVVKRFFYRMQDVCRPNANWVIISGVRSASFFLKKRWNSED